MDEQEALQRLAYGNMLMLTIPRDDLATLMDAVARLEQHAVITPDMVIDLSRIASDLSQQADAQE